MISELETPGPGGVGGNMSEKLWEEMIGLRRDAHSALTELRSEFGGRIERLEDRFDGYCSRQSEQNTEIVKELASISERLKSQNNGLGKAAWVKIISLILIAVLGILGIDVSGIIP